MTMSSNYVSNPYTVSLGARHTSFIDGEGYSDTPGPNYTHNVVVPRIISVGNIHAMCATHNSKRVVSINFMSKDDRNTNRVNKLFQSDPGMTVRTLLERLETNNSNYDLNCCVTKSPEWRLLLMVSTDDHKKHRYQLFDENFPIMDIPDWYFESVHLLIDVIGNNDDIGRRIWSISDEDLIPGYVTRESAIQSAKKSSIILKNRAFKELEDELSFQKRKKLEFEFSRRKQEPDEIKYDREHDAYMLRSCRRLCESRFLICEKLWTHDDTILRPYDYVLPSIYPVEDTRIH